MSISIYKIQEYGSHLPILFFSSYLVKGDFLELGGGFISTPLLAGLRGSRKFLTVESNLKWFKILKNYFQTPGHEIKFVKNWQRNHSFYNQNWGLILIDQQPESARSLAADRFRDKYEIMIFHDAESKKWGDLFRFPNYYMFNTTPPTAVSCKSSELLQQLKENLKTVGL